ncbi:MAG: septation protein SpoVG [Deltaproteobacteria bacterium]|nr:MAG: septation protein SpoVG [Deltaproteobacteria bacterium]
MEITEVKVFPVNEDKLKAYATITFDRCFVVRDLKIIQGNNGLFVAMPSKKRKDGTYKDTAHPLNTETREKIESAVLAEYRRELERTGAPMPEVGERKLTKKGSQSSEQQKQESSGESEDA